MQGETDARTTTLKVTKSDDEWRAQLTPEQYRITRLHGTERAFSSPDFNGNPLRRL